MEKIDSILNSLSKSKFRASFNLKEKDKKYVNDKGTDIIRSHANDFINKRLAPAAPLNDGKQTPMHGHPVFIAQHACACCCRKCLNKWHNIPENTDLNEAQKKYIVNLLMTWIDRQMKL